MKRLLIALAVALSSPLTLAQPASLDQLLQDIREIRSSEQAAMREREAQFLRERDNQQTLLTQAERELAPIKAEADRLKTEFDQLEAELAATETQMRERSGNLGELFGVVRQMAGDTRSQWQDSLLNMQFPERLAQLDQLAGAAQIPTVETLEQFWFMLQEDMTASGKISRFPAPVIGRDGQQQDVPVVLVGPFVALAEGEYLTYQAEAGTLQVADKQPDGRGLINDFLAPRTELADLMVDPTRGTVIGQMQLTPSFMDRVRQGGLVGYVIIALGVLGVVLALIKLVWLLGISNKVERQANSLDQLRDDNPLGRILGVIGSKPRLEELDTLELKLDEAILRETPALDRGNGLIKLLAAVAPLLGLLGTVTGMIATFQAITLFGTGDPKLMAGGISQALVTTVQGLVVAIPLLFLHGMLASRSKAVIQVLEQQSAGLIALHLDSGERRGE
ncbi:flagellar motor protein MotA [Pseudomonas sp. G11-1]|uniref:MotA/TolQ/ExbB proton channel family protein n=1 Tax=Halopseudomonas sp. SMJS2 TaxID=3041098 RepID=UPI002453433F|nr:MotA/TolQ/ExbB proton channel family protein [Halopseudomonas sp. SMJS2]MCO5787807.1 flagellar motor protein MotA [Pseudomonas sp. G11-1]MCO5791027.1 flagellar motor protein MotA [Pseudomonas sp. G11-2]WGK61962.1 MotA/TolQ/ExbB proton channel family protein [Halopseudomonas sp. SMJS2]